MPNINQNGGTITITPNVYTLPFTITNTAPGPGNILTVILNENYTNVSEQITFLSDYIIFDGGNNTFDVTAKEYGGVFLYGKSSFANCVITNVGVTATTTGTLAVSSGWITTANYGTILNCYSLGPMSITTTAGICYANNSGNISNCYSVGAMSTSNCAGICYTNSGTTSNCYSVGAMSAWNCGGICIVNSGTTSNCYSVGAMTLYCAGICLVNSGTITNCQTFGSIDDGCGGICYNNTGGAVEYCYASGSKASFGAYIVLNGTQATKSGNGVPSDAGGYLSPLSAWDTNFIPYLLSSFDGGTNYNTVTLTGLTVNQPSTNPTPEPNGNCAISANPSGSVTINTTTGALTPTELGTFTADVVFYTGIQSDAYYYGYTINNLTITTTGSVCLLKGAKISTPTNFSFIENLKENDEIISVFSKSNIKIKRIIKNYHLIDDIEKENIPILIKKNFFFKNFPDEDLVISGHHRIIFNVKKNEYTGVQAFKLPNISYLEDLSQFMVDDKLVYYHIELEDENEGFFANNIAVESYKNS